MDSTEIICEEGVINLNIPEVNNFVFETKDGRSGELSWDEKGMHFEGDADAAAEMFFGHLKQYIDKYIESRLKKGE